MVVGVLCNQVVSPDFVGGGQHELASVDDIPRCLCRVGGGGQCGDILGELVGFFLMHSFRNSPRRWNVSCLRSRGCRHSWRR